MIEAIPLQTLAALRDAVGRELPPTPWLEIDQSRVDTFADATDDHQWIHVDPVQAAGGPYGATIAHGFLTLALLAPFFNQVLDPADADVRVNYGFDKVRFTAPVPVGGRVRGRLRLEQLAPRGEMLEARTHAEVEIEGSDRPALIAGIAAYAAAKSGIICFTTTAAKELAGFGITVNAISPAAKTRMIASIPPDKLAEMALEIPMRRFAEPAEIAAAFLASDEAGYITGVVLPVDGGHSI